jgi:hypothetical protein
MSIFIFNTPFLCLSQRRKGFQNTLFSLRLGALAPWRETKIQNFIPAPKPVLNTHIAAWGI